MENIYVSFETFNDPSRPSPPAVFETTQREFFESSVLKIGRKVRVGEVPEPVVAASTAATNGTGTLASPLTPETPNSLTEDQQHQQQQQEGLQQIQRDEQATDEGLGSLFAAQAVITPVASPNPIRETLASRPEIVETVPLGTITLPALPSKILESLWFKSKVVSRGHAEMWLKDGQV